MVLKVLRNCSETATRQALIINRDVLTAINSHKPVETDAGEACRNRLEGVDIRASTNNPGSFSDLRRWCHEILRPESSTFFSFPSFVNNNLLIICRLLFIFWLYPWRVDGNFSSVSFEKGLNQFIPVCRSDLSSVSLKKISLCWELSEAGNSPPVSHLSRLLLFIHCVFWNRNWADGFILGS